MASAQGDVAERGAPCRRSSTRFAAPSTAAAPRAVRLTERLLSVRRDEQLSQIDRLVADVRGCDEEIARLRHDNERITGELGAKRDRASTDAALPRAAAPARARACGAGCAWRGVEPVAAEVDHLVFVELPDRYELVERAGPPPARNTTFELPELDWRLVVAGARRSRCGRRAPVRRRAAGERRSPELAPNAA